jgi:diacylglycerol kinase (ATP)
MSERVAVIVNPAAGRGRGGQMIPELTRIYSALGVTDIRQTQQKGDEFDIANAAIEDGATTIVVVGGDGTTCNVANAILNSGRDVRLGVSPAGTGNDFAKTLGTAKARSRSVAEAAVSDGNARADVGKIEDRFFLNCVGFGFDVAVLEKIGSNSWLRGNSVYLVTALQLLFSFEGTSLSIKSTASERNRETVMLLVIANSPWFGGMFRIAPDASVADGMLDAVAIRDLSFLRRAAVLAAVVNGKHSTFDECTVERAAQFDVSFAAPPAYETDGELHRARSSTVSVSCLPRALRVVSLNNLS